MVQIAFDGLGFAGACAGIAAVITAFAGLVWAIRRHPGGGSGSDNIPIRRRLPPAD
jgi:hypothetical protein